MSDSAMLGAAAITGLAVWEVQRAYCGVAPSLAELRDSKRTETLWRQRLLDADICVGGLALLAGGTAAWLSKSMVPIIVIGAAVAWTSYYHRSVLAGPTTHQIDGGL